MASLTPQQAASHLEEAIGAGELATQLAPGGHPLFAALDDARDVLVWVKANMDLLPTMADGTMVRIRAQIESAIQAVYGAMGTLRNDPGSVPDSLWPRIRALPWPWIAAGVGGLLLAGVLYQRRRPA